MFDLYSLFQKTAINNKSKIAIKFNDNDKISYFDLLKKSITVSKHLNHIIKKNENRVACIESDKSIETYVLILALIKSKITYFFLDESMPFLRKKKIIEAAKPTLYFFEKKKNNLKIKKTFNIKFFLKKKINYKCKEYPNLIKHNIYYMFTSGSTGTPKGAIINNINLFYFIKWGIKEFSFTNKTIHAGLNQIYFDNAVFDFFISIFSGACLVPIKKKDLSNPFKIIEILNQNNCNSWFSVPTLIIYLLTLKILNKKKLPSIKHFIFGGEPFPIQKLRILFQNFGEQIKYSNVYGPTETTCMCSNYNLKLDDFSKIKNFPPIGFLNKYFDGFLWDHEKKTKTNLGELVLKGPCVGQGYLDSKKIINSGFKKNPEKKNSNEIVYFTGDLMKKNKSGCLFFKGRVDNQIKHNGYRIELEEIEARLRDYKFIKNIVVYQKFNNSLSSLVGVLEKNKNFEEIKFKNFMFRNLPQYMLLNKIIYLDNFVKNSNGKIDRKKTFELVKKNEKN